MIEQVIIQSTADTSQAEQEYKGLRVEIRELKKELDFLEEGSAEYDATFTKLSNKMKQQQDRTKALRSSAADLGDILGNTSKVIGGVSQGFAGATAAMSLFGVENEALLRTIQKVQAFESIARTFTSLEETITKTLPALRNNIKAFFKDTNKLSLNIGVDTNVSGGKQVVQTIDSEAFEKAAKSSERMAQAQTGAAGAMSSNVGSASTQLEVEKQITAQKIEQLSNEKAIAKEKFNKAGIELNKQTLAIEQKINDLKNELPNIDAEYTNNVRKRIELLDKSRLSNAEYMDEVNKITAEEAVIFQTKTENTIKEVGLLEEKQKITQKDRLESLKSFDEADKSIKNIKSTQEKLNKTTTGFGKIWGQMKGILTGVGIAAIITIAIAAITKLIDYFKKMNDAIKETYANAMAYNQEYASAITKSTEKELSTLKALDAGYKNLGKNKQAQNKYLKDNAKFYKEIGIDVNKIIKGEKDYRKEIQNTTNSLIERGRAMGVVNLLIEKYNKQAELEQLKIINQQTVATAIKNINNGRMFEFVSENVRDYITQLYTEGFRAPESIINRLKQEFKGLTDTQLSGIESGLRLIGKALPDEFQKKLAENNKELTKTNEIIAKLEPQITGLFDNKDDKGDTTTTTVIKTYNELLQETINLYQGLNLNNPFTPEKIREIELQFENVKDIADKTIFEIANNEALSDEEKLNRISDVNQLIIKAERDKIIKLRQINIDNAKWERDNQLRQLKEQAAIQKNNYKQAIEDAKASLEKGGINQAQFNEIFNKVQMAAGTNYNTVKEFYDYLGGNEIVNRNDKFINGVTDIANSFKSINDGVETIDVNAFKNKIKELYGVDLDVTDPLKINLGSLSVDEFNYLQKLIELYQGYANTIQGIDIQSKSDLKANTEKNYAEQLDLINKQFTEIENEYNKYQSRLRTKINDNSNISFIDFITGGKSGYQNREDVISGLEADIEIENQRQESIKNTIKLKQEELLNQNITLEERTRINDELKQLDVDLTNSEEIESDKRLAIAEKEKEKRKEIFDATVQGLEDVTTIISNIYDANETSQQNNLKRLLNAREITQEQYEQRSEDLANEYAKKRQRIEIFQGLLSATSASIGAFTAAMRPDSGLKPPFNLIVAGLSSAAAMSTVLAQVATLRGLSIGDTSVNPVQSTAGTGLNYTLQEQQVSNERLLNSLTNQKVYVVESEITGVQARISEIQAMSIF